MKAGAPIGIAYFAVSLAVGLYWVQAGFTPLASLIFSATNMSSTGEFAAVKIMAVNGGFFELALTTILVNIRYLLMGASLSQRLPRATSTLGRLVIALGITDEIYAVNIGRRHISVAHYFGSYLLPVIGWSFGTLLGVFVGEIIPAPVQAAAGILLYAMFVAIVIPPIIGSSAVAIVAGIAAGVSVLLAYLPGVSALAFGWRVIICTVIAACIGATFFPHRPDDMSCVEDSDQAGESAVTGGAK